MTHALPAPEALYVYKPRRPQAAPLFRLVQDHRYRLEIVYDERFAPTYGPWRSVAREVADKFLACGVLDHGFSRTACGTACGTAPKCRSCPGLRIPVSMPLPCERNTLVGRFLVDGDAEGRAPHQSFSATTRRWPPANRSGYGDQAW